MNPMLNISADKEVFQWPPKRFRIQPRNLIHGEVLFLPKLPYLLFTDPTLLPQTICLSPRQFGMLPLPLKNFLPFDDFNARAPAGQIAHGPNKMLIQTLSPLQRSNFITILSPNPHASAWGTSHQCWILCLSGWRTSPIIISRRILAS